MRLIDADRLIRSLESEYANFESEKDYKTVLCAIGNAKTVDAYLFADVKRIEEQAIKDTKVKCRKLKGHWKYHSCSECGIVLDFKSIIFGNANFCPNCGADMRGGSQ